jgi:hypothetical protein
MSDQGRKDGFYVVSAAPGTARNDYFLAGPFKTLAAATRARKGLLKRHSGASIMELARVGRIHTRYFYDEPRPRTRRLK